MDWTDFVGCEAMAIIFLTNCSDFSADLEVLSRAKLNLAIITVKDGGSHEQYYRIFTDLLR